MSEKSNPVSRRHFLKTGVAQSAAGVAAAAVGLHPKEAGAADIKWHRSADVVVVGAGVSGLACACAARDTGASVVIVEENFDIGGRGIMSGGAIQLGGGHSLQKKYGTISRTGRGTITRRPVTATVTSSASSPTKTRPRSSSS
jgi:monoamine oxidase